MSKKNLSQVRETTPADCARIFGTATDAELDGAIVYFLEGPGVDHPKRNAILRIIARAGMTAEAGNGA